MNRSVWVFGVPVLGSVGPMSVLVAWSDSSGDGSSHAGSMILMALIPMLGVLSVIAYVWSDRLRLREPWPWAQAPFALLAVAFLTSTLTLIFDPDRSADEVPEGRHFVEFTVWFLSMLLLPVAALFGGYIDRRRRRMHQA